MLYLHIPYCHRKCTYCAFYSAVTSADKQAYVDALCRELADRHTEQPHPLHTVYMGGGTPTILSIPQLKQIADTINNYYDLTQLCEATIEANPEDLTPQYLQGLRSLQFFNRLSIGVQSFSDADLMILNRRHSSQQSIQAVVDAAQAGFDNISIDLIYGLPGQSLDQWRSNLSQAARLPISHLSAYALTVEEGTMLHRQVGQGRVALADDEMVLSHYDALQQWCSQEGFAQYEVSNYSRQGRRSMHNSRYWDRTPYLGVGAAAHSFNGTQRRWNIADVKRYVATFEHESETLSPTDAYNEYLMTALRTVEGIDKQLVDIRFRDVLERKISRFVQAGLIDDTPTHYQPTPAGLLQADGIASDLFELP